MKKYMLPILLAALSLGACRSLQVRDFHSNQSLPTRLPNLGLLVHERSFLEAFDLALIRDIVITNAVTGPYAPAPWVAYDVTDQALQDAFHVLGNELSDNLSKASDPKYGHARFKLLYYKRRNSGWGWTVASVSTLFVPNLLGMPVRTHRAELELQMEIVDADGKMLLRYTAPGVGKAMVAAYHGYDSSTATRKANLLALQDAMSDIKKKLEADVPALASQLEAAGTLRKPEGK
ncbi:MAG: hypothetical protein Q7T20_06125 [Saprospiraceae bacterium]|nr:hypothetical protein [Saprospiraceae bacterium]